MAICTYLNSWENEKFSKVSDPDLNELFQEVRRLFNNQYYVSEHEFTIKRWFKKDEQHKFYTLYKATFLPEVQMINFYVDNSSSSINTGVTKALLMAMFYGLINGFESGKG